MNIKMFFIVVLAISGSVCALGEECAGREEASDATGQVLDLPKAPAVSGRGTEMREVLEHILDTEYCGDAMMAGVTRAAALQGMAPVEDIGFVRPTEEDAVAVLCEMAMEEFDKLAANGTIHTVADIGRLWDMIALLGTAKEGETVALSVLDRMARQATAEWELNLFTAISCAWIELTIESNPAKCLELGRYFEEARGVDSKEFWMYVNALGRCDAFGRWPEEENLVELGRFICAASEQCHDSNTAFFIDRNAEGGWYHHSIPGKEDDPCAMGKPYAGLPGWVGSIQRKRLAERFENRDGSGGPLHERAAAELAADESELTDLREVYGDWTKEGEEE